MEHPCREVQNALTRLLDELCTWERNTGRQNVLIIREQGGFVCRAKNGKPVDLPDYIKDAQIIYNALAD